jgi:DNA-directed RNA polymerase specialized sigma54-like protein
MSNPKPRQKLRLELSRGIYGRLEMRQVLSPPMIDSEEALVEQARKRNGRRKGNRCVDDYVGRVIADENGENPLTDRQIVESASEIGYKIGRKDVALARARLGIKNYKERVR